MIRRYEYGVWLGEGLCVCWFRFRVFVGLGPLRLLV